MSPQNRCGRPSAIELHPAVTPYLIVLTVDFEFTPSSTQPASPSHRQFQGGQDRRLFGGREKFANNRLRNNSSGPNLAGSQNIR